MSIPLIFYPVGQEDKDCVEPSRLHKSTWPESTPVKTIARSGNLRHGFFRKMCEELKAVLIVFFRLILVGVELNE